MKGRTRIGDQGDYLFDPGQGKTPPVDGRRRGKGKRPAGDATGGDKTPSQSELLDRQLAVSALEKRKLGKIPNSREAAALKRWEGGKEEKLRWEHYRAIPLRHWVAMSGRQRTVLSEQAARHGIPFTGRTIDLPAVVKALHDFLAAKKFLLARDDDSMLDGPSTPALEEYRKIRTKREELFYQRDLGEWIRRDDVHDGLAAFAGVLRRAGETLQRNHGAEAHAILDEALTDAIGEIQRRFGEAELTAEVAEDAEEKQ